MRELLNRTTERWAIVRYAGELPNQKLAIFIHGFRGDYLTTWGRLPHNLSKYADSDETCRSWDYYFLGYNTRSIASYLDIAGLICTAWRAANTGLQPHRAQYLSLALFGHSLGTLGIRQALCATSTHGVPLLDALHSVTLFGSPINGSWMATLGRPFSPVAAALKPANPQLRMLRTWSEGAYEHSPWPTPRVVLGQGDWVVGHEYGELVRWPGDLVPEQTTLDHSELSKPDSWNDSMIMNFIRRGLK